MAVTADRVIVQLAAETAQYASAMRGAASVASQFNLRTSTALTNVDNRFVKLGNTALATSESVEAALKGMSAPVSEVSNGIDGLVAKFNQLNDRTSGGLPGLGGQGMAAGVQNVDRLADRALYARRQVRNLEFSVGNLFAQVNDVGVTAAMGMNPLIIALQQGTQFAQAFAGQRPGEVVKGLGAALGSLISPTTLLTLGLTAATAVLIQFGMSMFDSKEDSEEFEKTLSALISKIDELRSISSSLADGELDSLREKYGQVTDQIFELVRAQEQLTRIEAIRGLKGIQESLGGFSDGSLLDRALGLNKDTAGVIEVQRRFALTRADAEKLLDAVSQLSNASGPDQTVAAYERLVGYVNDITGSSGEITDDFVEFANQVLSGADAAQQLKAVLSGLDEVDPLEDLKESLGELRDNIRDARELGEPIDMDKLSELREAYGLVTDEVIEFVNAQERAVLAAADLNLAQSISDLAQAYEESSFSVRGYIDNLREAAEAGDLEGQRNALQAIREHVEDVSDATGVSAEEAAVLLKNTLDVENAVRLLIGATDDVTGSTDAWASAMASVRAEVSSILSLLSGFGNTVIDNASKQAQIDALQAGSTVAQARRQAQYSRQDAELDAEEMAASNPIEKLAAAAKRSAVEYGRTLDETLAKEEEAARERERLERKRTRGSGRSKRASNAVRDYDDSIRKQIAALNAETEVIRGLSLEQDKYGNALQRASKEAELLQGLQNKGVEITGALREEVAQLADEWLVAADKNAQATEEMERTKSRTEEFAGIFDNALTSAFSNSEDALKNLIDQLAVFLIKLALVKSFPDVFGAGGSIDLGFSQGGPTGPGGKYEPAGIVHKGEVVWSQADVARAGGVAAVEAMRLGVPGYASGGIVGRLDAPAPMSRASGASGGAVVNVNNYSSAVIEKKPNKQGGVDLKIVDKMIDEYISSGKGNKAMRNAYGLRPNTKGN